MTAGVVGYATRYPRRSNGLGFNGVGQHQDIPGQTNKRQPKAGSFRV